MPTRAESVARAGRSFLSPGGWFFPPPGVVHVLSHSGRAASIVLGEGRWAVFFPGGGIDDVYGLVGGMPMPTRARPPGPECGCGVRGAGMPGVGVLPATLPRGSV